MRGERRENREGDIYHFQNTQTTHTHMSLSVSTREAAHGIDPALFRAPGFSDIFQQITPFWKTVKHSEGLEECETWEAKGGIYILHSKHREYE
jgi:hypothetical protein